jgi:diguanylate cyclase (GGDEF)-like protein
VCIENALNRERLEYSALTDPMTQVRNRRFFEQRFPEELKRSERTNSVISCIFLDIDHFKSVNDNYGHTVGDEVIRQVALRVKDVLRTHDIFARYGGEEFVLLLPATSNEEAMTVAERIVWEVNRNRMAIDKSMFLSVTVSTGLATLEPGILTSDIEAQGLQLLETADKALYDAKGKGRNRAVNGGVMGLTGHTSLITNE